MYPGGRANSAARRCARFWSVVFAAGLAPRRWVTLEVPGRRSGRTTRFPVGMADWHGSWYLVSMLGERCHWVRNVRAARGEAVLRRRRRIPCRLVEMPVSERGPVIERFLDVAPGARPHIPAGAYSAARIPVFAVHATRPHRLAPPGGRRAAR
ncbi:nitroreductase/quinone reductase family protein [Amycolatopsis nivea]